MTKWAIKVPFPDWENFLYVCHHDTNDELNVMLFDDKQKAQDHAKVWKTYKVVEYREEEIYDQ